MKVGQYYHQGELTVQKVCELNGFPSMLEAFRNNNVEETAAAYFNTGLTENQLAFSNLNRQSHPDWVHEFSVIYIMTKDSTPAGWYYYRFSDQDPEELRTPEGLNKRIIKTAPFRLSNFGRPIGSGKFTEDRPALTVNLLNKIQEATRVVYESEELKLKGKACVIPVTIDYNTAATSEEELDVDFNVGDIEGLRITDRSYIAPRFYNAGIFIPKLMKAKGKLSEIKVVCYQIKGKTIMVPVDVKCV
jgi:hypothetical protein